MKGIALRSIGKEVVMSGLVLAYALTGSYPAVANVAPVAPHIAAYVCEHAAPPPGCSWVAGATCLRDRLACTNLFGH